MKPSAPRRIAEILRNDVEPFIMGQCKNSKEKWVILEAVDAIVNYLEALKPLGEKPQARITLVK